MATTNCSYIDTSGTYQELTCTANQYCCTATQSNTCLSSPCSSSSSESKSNSISPTLFWSILGGLFGTGIILIFLMYIICKFRTPNSCLSDEHIHDAADMFEEECHEINTVSHEQSRHQPRLYIRRESFWKITRRKSTNPRITCSRCADQTAGKNNETPKDDLELKNNITIIKNVAQNKIVNTKNISALPEVG